MTLIRNLTLSLIFIFIFSGCSERQNINTAGEGRIVILMYHRLTDKEPSNLYERSADDFEKDLKYLIENHIKILDFNDLERYFIKGTMPEQNSAIITFDDGDFSWYTIARPLLMKYGMRATFFLWTGIVGSNSFLTWNEVEIMGNYMNENGIRPFSFGSHTFSHPYLLGMKSSFNNQDEYEAFLDYEMLESKKIIEKYIPGNVNVLALPYGDGAGDEIILEAAARNGYRMIRTSKYGAIKDSMVDLYGLPSLPMLNDTQSEIIGEYLSR